MYALKRTSDNVIMESRERNPYPPWEIPLGCVAVEGDDLRCGGSLIDKKFTPAAVVVADTTIHDALKALDPDDSAGALGTVIEYLQARA